DAPQSFNFTKDRALHRVGANFIRRGDPQIERGADDVIVMEVKFRHGILARRGILTGRQDQPGETAAEDQDDGEAGRDAFGVQSHRRSLGAEKYKTGGKRERDDTVFSATIWSLTRVRWWAFILF